MDEKGFDTTVPLGGTSVLAADVRMLARFIADDWNRIEAETHAELLEQAARRIEELGAALGASDVDPCPKGDPDCETGDDGSCHDGCYPNGQASCEECGGTGRSDDDHECPLCDLTHTALCPACRGTGRAPEGA